MRSPATAACAAVIVLFCCPTLNAQDKVRCIEFGGVLSAGKQTTVDQGLGGLHFHVGGGGRFTVNARRYVAGEVELTAQPTGRFGYGTEWHTALAVKGTYRAEERRWLRFAGLNFN